MSGTIEFYKIDQSKTKTVLYKMLTDKNIEPKFNINRMHYFKSLKSQDEINETSTSRENGWVTGFVEYMISENQEAICNTIIQKVKEDFDTITHSEFECLMDWCLEYFYGENGEEQMDEIEKLGIQEVEYFFNEYNGVVFHNISSIGIEDYYYKLKEDGRDVFWTDLYPPCNYQEFNLALDFLILLCLKIKNRKDILTSYDNQLMNKQKLNTNYMLLDKSADAYLEDMFADCTENKFHRELERYLIDCFDDFLYKFDAMSEGAEGYKGKIFRLDCI